MLLASKKILLAIACPFLLLSSCASNPQMAPAGVSNAAMDLAMDTAGERMFYRGTAFIPRGFNAEETFELEIQLSRWGNPPANEASRRASHTLNEEFSGRARYQPLENQKGEIRFSGGRFQLRGVVLGEGQELDGEWFLDGLHGGGFRITRKGYLFP